MTILNWLTDAIVPTSRQGKMIQIRSNYIAGSLLYSSQMVSLVQCYSECLAANTRVYVAVDTGNKICFYYKFGTTSYNVQSLRVYSMFWKSESVTKYLFFNLLKIAQSYHY